MGGMMLRWLAGLSRRERRLLALLCALVLPAGAFFGVVQPLAEARAEAERRQTEAAATAAWMQRQAEIFATRAAQALPAERPAATPLGLAGIERSLEDEGLRRQVSQLAGDGEGGIALGFDTVSFLELADWLQAMEPDWGYRIARFSFTRGDQPDSVAADLLLEPLP